MKRYTKPVQQSSSRSSSLPCIVRNLVRSPVLPQRQPPPPSLSGRLPPHLSQLSLLTQTDDPAGCVTSAAAPATNGVTVPTSNRLPKLQAGVGRIEPQTRPFQPLHTNFLRTDARGCSKNGWMQILSCYHKATQLRLPLEWTTSRVLLARYSIAQWSSTGSQCERWSTRALLHPFSPMTCLLQLVRKLTYQ